MAASGLRLCTLLVVSMVMAATWHMHASHGAMFEHGPHHDGPPEEAVRVEVTTTYRNVTYEECTDYGRTGELRTLHYDAGHHEHHYQHATGTCVVTVLGASVSGRDSCTRQPENDACHPNPCKHSGICQLTNDTDPSNNGRDYTCYCHVPMGGAHCEECVNCFLDRKDGLVIFPDSAIGSVSWIQAYNYCRAKGMSLMASSDDTKNDFVRANMRKLHPDIDEKVAYWIGVNRTSSKEKFWLVDGTPMHPLYNPWAPNRPGSSNCVEIANGKQFDWKWDDESCDGYPGWSYYPLCEKYYAYLSDFSQYVH